MKSSITVERELRPCINIITDENLLFHHWVYGTEALCEQEDGELALINYMHIKFLDNKLKEYDFTDHQTEKGGVEG